MNNVVFFDSQVSDLPRTRELLEGEEINLNLLSVPQVLISVLEQNNFSLLILDIEAFAGEDPGNLQKIRDYHEKKEIPVVFLLENINSRYSPLHVDFSVEDVILKPYQEEEVALRIINILRKKYQKKFQTEKLKQLDILFDIGNQIHHSLDIQGVTQNILQIINNTFGSESSAIFLTDEHEMMNMVNYRGGVNPEDLKRIVRFTSDMVVEQNKLLIFEDLSQELLWKRVPWKDPDRLKNAVCIPLRSHEQKVVGSIELYNSPPDMLSAESEKVQFFHKVSQEVEKVLNLIRHFSKVQKDLNVVIDELTILYEISNALSSTLNLDHLLNLIVKSATNNFKAQVVSLMMLDKEKGELTIRFAEGLKSEIIKGTRVKLGEGIAGRVAKSGQPLLLVDMMGFDDLGMEQHDIKSALSVPLKIKDEVIGVLNVSKTSRYRFTEMDLKILFNLASLAAQAIEKASLYKDIKDSLEELKTSYMSTVKALSRAIEAKDPYTQGHVDRVAQYGMAIAMELDTDLLKDDMFRYALLLHDIGKIEVPDAILCKQGPLTDEEFEVIKKHPDTGAKIISPIKVLRDVAEMVRCHQERYDGKGYPLGLKGDEIPLVARIISVADTFDAITSSRPYRAAKSVEFARQEIEKNANGQFDPVVVKAFTRALDKKVIP